MFGGNANNADTDLERQVKRESTSTIFLYGMTNCVNHGRTASDNGQTNYGKKSRQISILRIGSNTPNIDNRTTGKHYAARLSLATISSVKIVFVVSPKAARTFTTSAMKDYATSDTHSLLSV